MMKYQYDSMRPGFFGRGVERHVIDVIGFDRPEYVQIGQCHAPETLDPDADSAAHPDRETGDLRRADPRDFHGG